MITIKKHTEEHLDGTKGSWRPHLAPSFLSSDGMPAAWQEMVVISCPKCALQFGVGKDEAKIQADGTTTAPVRCFHCKWSDTIKLDQFDQPAGREHFGKLKDFHTQEVHKARITHVHAKVMRQMQAEMHERALEEAKRLLQVTGDVDGLRKQIPPDLFREVMGSFKK